MFFSTNDLYEACKRDRGAGYGSNIGHFYGIAEDAVTKHHVKNYVRTIKRAIVNRQSRVPSQGRDSWPYYVSKWFRPWEIVPALRDFRAPAGEFAVGVEVEMGFQSLALARAVAQHVQHWKHIALDFEGGSHPIEATFPPVLYSKYGSKSQASRYLKFISRGFAAAHSEGSLIGTHVNVSKGGAESVDYYRMDCMADALRGLSGTERQRYFGRYNPYGYCYNQGRYVEFKMFNSTTDWKRLRQYVDVAVAIADLLYGTESITMESVRTALETGYNKRNRKART